MAPGSRRMVATAPGSTRPASPRSRRVRRAMRSGCPRLPPRLNFRVLMPENLMDKLVSLAKRRGFVFQSSEIYGGLGSVWDYGPLGVELKKKNKEAWGRSLVPQPRGHQGPRAPLPMHPQGLGAPGPPARL